MLSVLIAGRSSEHPSIACVMYAYDHRANVIEHPNLSGD